MQKCPEERISAEHFRKKFRAGAKGKNCTEKTHTRRLTLKFLKPFFLIIFSTAGRIFS